MLISFTFFPLPPLHRNKETCDGGGGGCHGRNMVAEVDVVPQIVVVVGLVGGVIKEATTTTSPQAVGV
jgi:hypothetical protein